MRRPLALAAITLMATSTVLAACGSTDGATVSTADYCELIRSYQDDGDAFDSLFSSPDADPATLKAGFEKMGSMIDDLSAKAPADIKTDVDLVAKATNALIDLLEKYDYDFMAMVADEEASAELESLMGGADVGAASERLDAWGQTNCGIEPGS